MIKINWNKYSEQIKANTTFVFFAQRMNEMLFDYSIDSFKPRALNTPLLCEELINTSDEVEKGIIDSKNLNHIYEELQWSLRRDLIAKEMVGERVNQYLEGVNLDDKSRLRTLIQLLQNKINDFDYLTLSSDRISELIKSSSPSKKDLDSILVSFLTGVYDLGYSKNFIYHEFKRIFENPSEEVNDYEQIDQFFSIFTFKNKRYKVIFKANKIFSQFKDSCTTFGLKVAKDIDELKELVAFEELSGKSKEFLETIRPNQVFIIASRIKELDSDSARKDAISRLEKVSNLFVFYHHKTAPTWNNRGLVLTLNDDDENLYDNNILISDPTPVLHKTFDLHPVKANQVLKKVLKNFGLRSDSFKKFDTAIDLHASAVKAREVENQLLNLWISIETLIPSPSSNSKIVNYKETIGNFMTQEYVSKIFKAITKYLLRFDQPGLKSKLESIDLDLKLHEKVAALIICEKYKPEFDLLINELEANPLFKYRILLVKEQFSKGKNIKKQLLAHQSKLKLQVQRIYRTRNLIIHSGRKPNFTEYLAENLHNYVDTTLKTLIEFRLDNERINTIEEACLEAELIVSKNLQLLETINDNILEPEQIKTALFGKI